MGQKRTIFRTLPSRPKHRSRVSPKGQRPKETLNYTSKEHQIAEKRLRAEGDWCESVLLTITPRRPHYDEMWIIDTWVNDVLKPYYAETKTLVGYHITSNRGKTGKKQASGHVMFEEPLPDIDLLQRLLLAAGCRSKVTTAGGETVFYMGKNLAEPDAVERSSKWRDRERKQQS